MTIHVSSRTTLIGLALALTLLGPAAVVDAGNTNNNAVAVPASSPAGLASLAGGLALVGSWFLARRGRRK